LTSIEAEARDSVGGVETRRAAGSHDAGSVAVEAVVIIPVAMMVILLVIQVCLWAHAATLVQGAATAGEQAATALGGSPAIGETEARGQLTATASQVVVDPSVNARVLTGGVVEVSVAGTAESIIPWLRLPVSATRTGLSQGFRESG
jgi:TadE-like protein